jgi:integral membrane protein
MTETTGTPVESIRKALLGYRATAWITGIWLIALCYEMVMKYGFGVEGLSWIAVVHGWVYFVYLLFTANLAVKVRWPIAKTIGILLAGTSRPQVRCLSTSSARRSPRSSCRKCDAPSIFTCSAAVGIRSQKACPALGYGKIGS